jgi:tetratricopeptide (TPR) repeat protein
MSNLAASYTYLGRYADAIKLHEETLALRKVKLGPDHPDTLVSMNDLALSYAALGRHADALKFLEETLALRKAKLGPDHPDTAATIYDIACVHSRMIPKSGDGAKHADLAMEWLQKGRRRGLQRRGATEEG